MEDDMEGQTAYANSPYRGRLEIAEVWTECSCCSTDYGFEYSDEEPEEEDVDIENQYYNSKGT